MANKNIITVTDRQQVMLSGVTKVSATSPTQIVLELGGESLVVTGSNFEVKKLDVENGNLEIAGMFEAMKFVAKKENFMKRLFK